MGLFDAFRKTDSNIEERSIYTSNGQNLAIISMLGGGSTITEEKAMSIPAVSACLNLIQGTISQLPIYLYQENGEDVTRIPDGRTNLLNLEANLFTDSQSFKRQVVKDYLLYGKAVIYAPRKNGQIVSLNALKAKDVQYKQFTEDYVTLANIEVTYSGMGANVKIDYSDLIIIDSGTSGILANGAITLELALEQNSYSSNILKNGALPTGILKTANKLSETALKRLRDGWTSLYTGGKNAGKTVILEEGVDYKALSFNPEQLQLNKSKKAIDSDICKMFGVDESLITAEFTKYSTNSNQNLAYLQYTLAPIITAIESALDKSLLTQSEKDNGYYFRFDTKEILRSTEFEKIEAVGLAVSKGLYSLNEGRSALDKNKIENDYFMFSLGNVLYNAAEDEFTVPNMLGTIDNNGDGPTKVFSSKVEGTTNTNEGGVTTNEDGIKV